MNHFHKIISNFHMHRCVQNRRCFFVCWGIWKRVSPSSTSNIALKMFNSSTSRAFTIILWACRILFASSKIKSVMDHFLFAHWRFRVCRKNATQSGWPQHVLNWHPHIGGCAILPGTKRVSNYVLVLNPFIRRGKSLGWNASVWFASFGMPKAFDRVEYDPAVGSTYVYCSLLSALYQHQQGALRHGLSFSMQRGVKQTDVISSFFWSC